MDSVTVTKQKRLSAGAEMIRTYNARGLKLKYLFESNNITKDKQKAMHSEKLMKAIVDSS